MSSSKAIKASLIIAILLLTSLACDSQRSIVGKWDRFTSGVCDELKYPNRVEFADNGTYSGGTVFWSGGQYAIEGSHIQLETRLGRRTYNFSMSDDVLTFIDDSNCEFKYRRSK